MSAWFVPTIPHNTERETTKYLSGDYYKKSCIKLLRPVIFNLHIEDGFKGF